MRKSKSTAVRPQRGSGKPRPAPDSLVLLDRWESFVHWLLERTERWPKISRSSLTVRVENIALDGLEYLIVARYDPAKREERLLTLNLLLERLRVLLRIAHRRGALSSRALATAVRRIDECGRMSYGWRTQAGRVTTGSVQ